jgi:mannose-6-phosphate isomerase-like protein (cupin superfamily)
MDAIRRQECMMTENPTGRAIELAGLPVHFVADGRARTIDGFSFDPSGFEQYIAADTTPTDPGRLVFIERSETSWGMWECHTAGDELVIVISGVAQFIQEIDGTPLHTRVTAGQAVLNPAGVWHTADVEEPFDAVYLTPCPGTNHRPR